MSLEKHLAKITETSAAPSDAEAATATATPSAYSAALGRLTAEYERYVLACWRKPAPSPNTYEVLEKAARWLSGEHRPWLMLVGRVGTGKTALLHALRGVLAPRFPESQRRLGTGEFLPGALLDRALRMAKYDEEGARRAVLAKALLIDDFGVEPVAVKSYGNDVTNVTDILYERYERRRCTILSTNLTLRDVGERYGERVADRLTEVADRIVFDFPSFRSL